MIPAPNLPIAPVQYDKTHQDNLARILRLYFNRLASDQIGVLSQLTLQTPAATTLANLADIADTTLDLVDAESFATAGFGTLSAGGTTEKFEWSGKTGNTLTGVLRGQLGSTAQAHAAGTVVVPFADVGKVYAHPVTDVLYRVR